MPLSSSSVDRRIPEALSTSRERNLVAWPRAALSATTSLLMVLVRRFQSSVLRTSSVLRANDDGWMPRPV